ncbi:MAG: glutamate--tRNA ligase [Alphaproteobacteria bacterium 64-11]|nr:glutamate--tRNA ligase [Alphaproteobacteria bacterium]OJU11859.1 MAG: glutamate--tRNA ligase [Alphaproteobacteria bacterium 64-11]
MTATVRFAPSPTGLLHVGNARTAIVNALFAKKHGGRFILRIDDTDAARSKKEYEDAIIRDLSWLDLAHDAIAHQSARIAEYQAAFEKLVASGHVYPAFETELELDRKRSLAAARHLPPVYDRASLDPATKARWEAEGRTPHWRFKLSRTKVSWTDLIRGPVEIDTATQSDPVLRRADGTFLYTFPSVVDDAEMAITHVIRGEDHVTNTAAQIEIFRALGATPPAFAHHPLLVGAGGEALSKRLGSLSLQSLREDGLEPLAIASYLAKIGTSDAVEPRPSLDDLAADFDFGKIGRAPAHFDSAELTALNARLLHHLPYDAVAARLSGMGVGPALWEAIHANLTTLADAKNLALLVTGPVTPLIEDAALAAAAARLLPPEPWDQDTWPTWTKAVSAETGARGRALYHPLRLALTGRGDGPELKKLLPLIGRARTLARLEGKPA